MARGVIQANIQTADGFIQVAPNASVSITLSSTAGAATLYDARIGGSTVANPVLADATGFFRVYVDAGRYDIAATFGGVTQTFKDLAVFADGFDPLAANITYDNTTSGLAATEVQSAIDEAATDIAAVTINYFEESRNTTAPNATVPAHQWAATGAETNIDVVFSPKGAGAILAQVPDGTATGGNKRGSNSVDFQQNRSVASNVASGEASVIGGGSNNTASGIESTVSGGRGNDATNNQSTVGGGEGNTASGTESTISGGYVNIALSQSSTVGGGSQNYSSGNYSTIPGGLYSFTRGLYGRYSYASGRFAVLGDAQKGEHILRSETTDSTPESATADSLAESSTNVSVLPNNHAYAITATIIARDTTTGDAASWKIEGLVKRGADAASTSIVGTPSLSTIAKDTGAAGWTVELVADTTLGAAKVEVTGETGSTIHWVTEFKTVEVG
jgi:hypothetical protein